MRMLENENARFSKNYSDSTITGKNSWKDPVKYFIPIPMSKSSPGEVKLTVSFTAEMSVIASMISVIMIFRSTILDGEILSLLSGVFITC